MKLSEDRERVKVLLKDTITLLCKNGLDFKEKFSLEALIGVTLDEKDVFLVSLNQVVNLSKTSSDDNHGNHSSNHDDGSNNDSDKEIAPKRHKRQKRRHPTSGQTHNAASTHTTQTYSNNTASRQTPQASDPHVKVESSNQSGCHLSEEHPELDLTASNADLKSEQSITMVKAVPNTTETGDLMIVSMVKEESVYALHGEVTPEHVCVTSQDIHGANIPRTNPQGTFSADWITAQGISTPTVSMATQGDTQVMAEVIITTSLEDTTRQETSLDNTIRQQMAATGDMSTEDHLTTGIETTDSSTKLDESRHTPQRQNSSSESVPVLCTGHENSKSCKVCDYEGCTYSTPHRSCMIRHKRRHTNAFFVCPECGKKYVESYDLRNHISSVHTKEGHLCNLCGQMMSSKSGFLAHQKKHKACVTMTTPNALSDALEAENTMSQEQMAMPQDQIAMSKENVKIEGDVFSQCDVTDAMSPSNETRRQSYNKLRHCVVDGCDFSSMYRASMIRHTRRCHPEDDNKIFRCNKCSKTFVEKYNLRCHMDTAHGSTRFGCNQCDKVFRHKASLERHIKTRCVPFVCTD